MGTSFPFTISFSPPPSLPVGLQCIDPKDETSGTEEVPEYARSILSETSTCPAEPEPNPSDAKGQSQRSHVLTFLTIKPSLILENSGSVARDHLASERYAELTRFSSPMSRLTDTSTFLAYVRTSLAIASTGVGELLIITGTPLFFMRHLYKALVQLFSICPNTSSSRTALHGIQANSRPLGAITVCFGMSVLAIGTCPSTCPSNVCHVDLPVQG
jgi:uncharacterized membrane protein YidH (DUF202 family)